MIDTSTEFGKRVALRLSQERIVWLTTVRRGGSPDPSPVWFHWDGEGVVIYSRPNTQKVRNIAHNSKVALNLDGDGHGGNIVVLNGDAVIEDGPPAHEVPAFAKKYADGFKRIGMSAEAFARTYSVRIRVTPTGLRGH